jgi:hypothetical protein
MASISRGCSASFFPVRLSPAIKIDSLFPGFLKRPFFEITEDYFLTLSTWAEAGAKGTSSYLPHTSFHISCQIPKKA